MVGVCTPLRHRALIQLPQMDDPGDDPRAQAMNFGLSYDGLPNSQRDSDEDGRPVGGMANILQFLSTILEPSGDQRNNSNGNESGGGMRIMISGPRGVRTVQFGGPNILGQGSAHSRGGGVPRLSEYAFSGSFPFLVNFTFTATSRPQPENPRPLTEVKLGALRRPSLPRTFYRAC